jgi:hypothetical protein
MKAPEKLIKPDGRLQPEVIDLLSVQFGFNKIILEKTVYKEIRFQKNAITLYKHVFFDRKCYSKSEQEWLLLIIHEQFHREEIGNNFLKALGWYAGYLVGYMKSGFSYRQNAYEIRAYDFEAAARKTLFGNLS